MKLMEWIRGLTSTVPKDAPMNWFQFPEYPQAGVNPNAETFAPAYSCVKIIAEEVARLHLRHYRTQDKRKSQVTTSAASRVFRKPNGYQSRTDFWLAMVYGLLFTGNAYAIAQRNSRWEITGLWPQPPRSVTPMVDPMSGDIFYSFTVQEVDPFDIKNIFPASEVLHLRLFCPRDPLIGETPIQAAIPAIVSGSAQRQSEAAFFTNRSRPSGILTTDQVLSDKRMLELRRSWDEQARKLNTGGMPMLNAGMKFQQMGMTSLDAQAIEAYKMSVDDVARIFRMPLFMLGDYSKTTYSNTEQLTRTFYISCLGFYLEHIEAALNDLFNMPANETAEFDVEQGLLRSEFKERMDGYSKGVQGGVMAPNEARARENLPPVEGGDQVLVQQQMVPVDQAGQEPPAPEPETIEVQESLPEPVGNVVDFQERAAQLLRQYCG